MQDIDASGCRARLVDPGSPGDEFLILEALPTDRFNQTLQFQSAVQILSGSTYIEWTLTRFLVESIYTGSSFSLAVLAAGNRR